MKKRKIKTINGLLGGLVVSTHPPKCETCKNDAASSNCVKLHVYGGSVCVCVN
ncbi:MAG: hypothetical protein II950_06375 [Prevotella sp.]|nr:hypothetical protein [Prevotella sp.]